jgi:8-oxo-dGTP pyrophosphatase MutT (NUDIX family)
MSPTKACPVVVRHRHGTVEILAFRHPSAGLQLVKGGIEPGEASSAAALRELWEEAGVYQARVERDLGIWDSGIEGQVWAFYLVKATTTLPDTWSHRTNDDGGQIFQFFWHDLSSSPSSEWHLLFRGALKHLSEGIRPGIGTAA